MANLTISTLTNSQSSLPVDFCTDSKSRSEDYTLRNYCSVEQLLCTTCCNGTIIISPTLQTVHRTIAIGSKNQAALNVALLHLQ